MNDQTPEMERLDAELRALMREWVQHPENRELKERYNSLHHLYQQLLLGKTRNRNGVAHGVEQQG